MTEPAEFPDAGAVIIFDKGIAITEMNGLELKRHTRLKIFSRDGFDKVKDVEIEYFHYDKLFDLEAQIIKDDNTVKKLDDDFFDTIEKGAKRICRFSFKNVEPGDIIEYKYGIDYYEGYDKLGPEVYFIFSQVKTSAAYKYWEQNKEHLSDKYWEQNKEHPSDEDTHCMRNIPTWFFDHDVYCLKSEFVAKIGADFDYLFLPANLPQEKEEPAMKRIKFLTATAYKQYTWQLENVHPYFKDTNSVFDSELIRIGLHFMRFSSVGLGQNRILRVGKFSDKHWEFMGRNIQGFLNEYVNVNRSMKKKFIKIAPKKDPTDLKIQNICNYLRSEYNVDSTGYYLRPTHSRLKNLYKKKYGMPFEINLLMVEMLKSAGVKAYPVLISTRDKLSFEKTGEFNHMLVMVVVGDENLFFDASCKEGSYDFIPEICKVDKGLLIDYDSSRIVDITY